MNWSNPADFVAMGGYGLYVWGSFAVGAACVIAETLLLGRRRRVTLTRLKRAFAQAQNPQ